MESMSGKTHRTGAAMLCLMLSLLVHGALAALLLLIPEGESKRAANGRTGKVRMVQVLRMKAEEKKPQEAQEEKAEKHFAKTSADEQQQRPEQADYEGARNTRAMSDPTARDRRSEAEAPASHGRERAEDEEIVTFDQERQEGDLDYEGKEQTTPAPTAEADEGDAPYETPPSTPTPPAMLTASPLRKELFGELQTDTAPQEKEPTDDEAWAEPTPPQRAARRRYYDPALSAAAQRPGFRTAERRTRSSGRFIFGKGAALNVEATPRGQYEAEIYRRVARLWYAACDDHRGDIIPGRLTISLRLDHRGRLVNMHLMSRSGASVSQQSFTFAAIRRAALPAMPAAVQSDMVGDLLELIFTFHFD